MTLNFKNEHRARRLIQMDHEFAVKFIPHRYLQDRRSCDNSHNENMKIRLLLHPYTLKPPHPFSRQSTLLLSRQIGELYIYGLMFIC
jgi:hypothetical protein